MLILIKYTRVWALVLGLMLSSNAFADYKADTVVSGLGVPWGMAFLPNGEMLVSERQGSIKRIREGKVIGEVKGVPDVHANGQGGLLDLALHPDFAKNQMLYFTYSDKESWGSGSNTALAKGRLIDGELQDVEVLYKGEENTRKGQHYGSRIAFDPDGYVYFSIGDRGNRKENPQDLERDGGKIYRLHADGRVPNDNPFMDTGRPAVYSYGHRNPQGMAVHPITGEIWTHEHGPRGGDEVNLIKAGANYGWPILSYGVNYSGTSFAKGTERAGFESPLWYWDPSIAPSGMAFVTSDRYPEWKGQLLVGSLKFGYLVLCHLDGNRITRVENVLEGIGRVRSLRQGPDGYLYVGVDGQGIKKIVPAN